MKQKKPLILLVLKLLETETDSLHPITQTEIAKVISDVYPCERKTVGRNIKLLKDLGYPIVKTQRGFYMDQKMFTLEDVIFVQQAILQTTGKTVEDKTNLADSIFKVLSAKYIR